MEQLARLRGLKGYSQRALAKESGVSPATIYELENGRRRPNPSTLRKLADALDVKVADLLEHEHPLGEAPSSSQLTLDGALEEAQRAAWGAAVEEARRLREPIRARLEELLAAWDASKERGELSTARRGYLNEMGELLQQAYDAETALVKALSGPRIAAQWPEVQRADRFYVDLWRLVQDAGLSIRTGIGEATGEQAQPQMIEHEVKESAAA